MLAVIAAFCLQETPTGMDAMDHVYLAIARERALHVRDLYFERAEAELWRFAEALNDFLYELEANPQPDWRNRLDGFFAEQATWGREVQHQQELIAYLEGWAATIEWGKAYSDIQPDRSSRLHDQKSDVHLVRGTKCQVSSASAPPTAPNAQVIQSAEGEQPLSGLIGVPPHGHGVDGDVLTDLNPNGPRPPEVPLNAELHDFANRPAYFMHIHLYEFYGRSPARVSDQDWVVLGGQFLELVKMQSGQLALNLEVDARVKKGARVVLQGLAAGDSGTFSDRGSETITADLWSSPVVRLSLQRYTVYWEANFEIGPRRRVRLKEGTAAVEADLDGTITWTLHDHYNFEWFDFPYGYLGNSFFINGSWRSYLRTTIRL